MRHLEIREIAAQKDLEFAGIAESKFVQLMDYQLCAMLFLESQLEAMITAME
jgi:hypothetical protein